LNVNENTPAVEKKLTAQLREATRAQHIALEGKLDLFREGLTLAKYAALLNRWFVFLNTWEPAAKDWFSKQGDFFSSRSKLDLLRKDLAACNTHPSSEKCDLGSIAPADPATAIGTFYVLEGSTLGGQIIAPRIHQLLGLTPERGCAFFNGYGSQTGAMWSKTKAFLDQIPADHIDRVVAKANETFDWLSRWLPAESAGRNL
jgi:heme oxygenase